MCCNSSPTLQHSQNKHTTSHVTDLLNLTHPSPRRRPRGQGPGRTRRKSPKGVSTARHTRRDPHRLHQLTPPKPPASPPTPLTHSTDVNNSPHQRHRPHSTNSTASFHNRQRARSRDPLQPELPPSRQHKHPNFFSSFLYTPNGALHPRPVKKNVIKKGRALLPLRSSCRGALSDP